MLTAEEANTLLAAHGILEREGKYRSFRNEDSQAGYVAGKADSVKDALFDYLNCAAHYVDDEEANRVLKEIQW